MSGVRVSSLKRPSYFNGQLLDQNDFTAEQQHHADARRAHNQTLHHPGIIAGLEVSRTGDTEVSISPGYAIDAAGHAISVAAPQTLSSAGSPAGSLVYVTLAWEQALDEADKAPDDTGNYNRTTEYAVLSVSPEPAAQTLQLARLQLDPAGHIAGVDNSVRKLASSLLAPSAVASVHISDGAISLPKLDASLRSGWVRMPFKPARFMEPGAAKEFLVGVTWARCGAEGAKGTMTIPTPPGANKLRSFRIAGAGNAKGLRLELWRSAWDSKTSRPLEEEIFKFARDRPSISEAPFDAVYAVNKPLDPVRDALAVYLEAYGEATVNFVAAEFEWSL
jgi:hypothetical protein